MPNPFAIWNYKKIRQLRLERNQSLKETASGPSKVSLVDEEEDEVSTDSSYSTYIPIPDNIALHVGRALQGTGNSCEDLTLTSDMEGMDATPRWEDDSIKEGLIMPPPVVRRKQSEIKGPPPMTLIPLGLKPPELEAPVNNEWGKDDLVLELKDNVEIQRKAGWCSLF